MKRSVLVTITAIPVLAVFIFMGSCTEKDQEMVLDLNNGSMMFWTNKALYTSALKVHISSNSVIDPYSNNGFVTQAYTSNTLSSPPACDAAGCFREPFKGLEDDIYYWTAIDSSSPSLVHRWSGNFEIKDDNREHCNNVMLTY